jgi:transposase
MVYEAAQVMLLRSAKWSWLKAWAMKIAKHHGRSPAMFTAILRASPV